MYPSAMRAMSRPSPRRDSQLLAATADDMKLLPHAPIPDMPLAQHNAVDLNRVVTKNGVVLALMEPALHTSSMV